MNDIPLFSSIIALGGSSTSCFHPRRYGIPQNAIAPQKVDENISKGVKGILPLGCLPHWGREGVTLIAAAEINLVTEKRISAKRKN